MNPPFGDRSREKMAHGKETGQTALGMRGSHLPLMQTLFANTLLNTNRAS